jgi:hypothetical protein
MSEDFWSDSKRRVPFDKSCPTMNGTTDDSLHTKDALHALVRSWFIHRWATIRGRTAPISVGFQGLLSGQNRDGEMRYLSPGDKENGTERIWHGR